MGSASKSIEDVVDHINNNSDDKVGILDIKLYRPWPSEAFVKNLPKSVKKIAILDKTLEETAHGNPLQLDIVATIHQQNLNIDLVTGASYGLSSKEFTPNMIKSV